MAIWAHRHQRFGTPCGAVTTFLYVKRGPKIPDLMKKKVEEGQSKPSILFYLY